MVGTWVPFVWQLRRKFNTHTTHAVVGTMISEERVRLLRIMRHVLSGGEADASVLGIYASRAGGAARFIECSATLGLRNSRRGDANLWAHHGDCQTGRSIHLRHVGECVLIPG